MRGLYCLFVAFLAAVCGPRVGAADLLISEFMASNKNTLVDEDGDSSDWIEVYNAGSAAVDLEGWNLTDDPRILEKWAFPAISLDSQAYLLVFASGKNRRVAGDELHTNFRISAGGEYLALVQPDGATVAHEYAPVFPEQLPDYSYGIGQEVQITHLVEPQASLRYTIPVNDADGKNWTGGTEPFDDAGWSTGTTGIGYVTTVPGFFVTNYKANTSVSNLSTAYDVIASADLQTSLSVETAPFIDYQGQGNAGHYTNDRTFPGAPPGADVDDFVVDARGIVTIPSAGAWTFGVQSDDGFRLELNRGPSSFTIEYPEPRGPADTLGVFNVTTPGTYDLRLVVYERGGGAMVELFAAPGSYSSWNSGSFRLLGDVANGGLEVRSSPTDAGSLGGFEEIIGTDIETAMLGVSASAYVRIPFTVSDPAAYDTLFIRAKYEDGFIAYLNGVEVASRNAPFLPGYYSMATANRSASQASLFEHIDITSGLGFLQTGENILAFHGLNDDANSPEFVLYAELADIEIICEVPSYFDVPTPGQPNNLGFFDIVRDTKFSVDRGFYTQPFDVEITTETPGAVIRYTLDGTEPTAVHGLVYSGPIRIDRTTVLRAMAFKDDLVPANVDTHTYIFLDDVITQDYQAVLAAGFPSSWGGTAADYGFDMTLISQNTATIRDDLQAIPTISIAMHVDDMFGPNGIYTNSTNRGVAWERACSVELIKPQDGGGFQEDCGIRIQGGYFRRHDASRKHGLRLLFKGIYGATKLRYPLFGPGVPDRFDTIVLRCCSNDGYGGGGGQALYIRDSFSRQSALAMGQASSHETFVHLYINGIYWGLYNPVERPDNSFSSMYYAGDKEEWDAISHRGVKNGSRTAWDTLVGMANAGMASNDAYFEIQGKNSDGTDNPDLEDYLDVENFIDYMMVNLWLGNRDWPHNNYWMGRRRVMSTGFKFYIWDAEHVLFINSDVNTNQTGVTAGISAPWMPLRDNAEFRMLVADRVHRQFFNGGVFYVDPANPQWDPAHPERNVPAARFAQLADTVDRAMVAESARWGNMKHSPSYNHTDWENARDRVLRDWMPYRTARVLQQFRSAGFYPSIDAPSFSRHGGTISEGFVLYISGMGGRIYYTLDGSDPRLMGGGIGPSVHTIEAPTMVTLLPETATGRVLVPQDGSLGLSWTSVGFNDSAWTSGPMGVGYERGSGYESLIGTDVGDAMYSINGSAYVRVTFTVNEPGALSSLRLFLMYEDGFVAYINGMQVAADNAPASPQWNSIATASRSDGVATQFAAFPLSNPTDILRDGENVLALHLLNVSISSSDALILPKIEAAEGELGENAVVLNDTTWVRARARSGSEWSALNEALFTIPTPYDGLRITEIMYHPRENDIIDGDLYEFLEIKNTGTMTLDLTGISFSAGVRYEFPEGAILPPGALGVLVVDHDAFLERYPDIDRGVIMGTYDGNLSNNGEILTIIDPHGATITDVTYDDGPPWPSEPDGLGPSLVPIDPSGNGDPTKPSSWRASWFHDGSPGEDDPSEQPEGGWQLPGDLNQDARLDISDSVAMLLVLFGQASHDMPCDGDTVEDGGNLRILDVNGDGGVDLADPIFVLSYLFGQGPEPIRGTACIFVAGCPDTCR